MPSTLQAVLSAVALAVVAVPITELAGQPSAAFRQIEVMRIAKTVEDLRYHRVVAGFANLEHLLLDVPDITDAQRERVERLEHDARGEFFRLGLPLREARRTVLRKWPVEDDIYERSLNALIVAQRELYSQARASLDSAQATHFDRNTVQFWRSAEEIWRPGGRGPTPGGTTGIWVWTLYVNPFLPLLALDAATTP
ncbi:MAG: hypothetical protein H7305_03185 [Gemmatimonadaceae bacterium]|nr:hypothetical protein [Gemmatimonadaceae bacterium]